MDDKYKKLLKQGKEDFDAFANEPHSEVNSFVEELLPLLGDYFVGNFAYKGGSIICTFANGQTIKLTATEVLDADEKRE